MSNAVALKYVADNIFNRYVYEVFDEDNATIQDVLEILDDIYYKLKKSNNPIIKGIAKQLHYDMDQYCSDNSLCPECFGELEYHLSKEADWYEPEEGQLYCSNCGYSED